MTNAWQEYKKKLAASPLGLVNPYNYASEEKSNQRMDICLSCDRLIEQTKQCKECGCFMSLKTKLEEANCPLNKW